MGEYAITVTGDAVQGNYNVTYVDGTLVIVRAPVVVTANNQSKQYGEYDPELTVTVTGLQNNDAESVIDYQVTRAAGENVGEYAITPSGDAEQGNYSVTYVPGTLTTGAADHVGGVAFGDYSTLKVVVAEGELGLQVGRLAVNGTVSVSGTGSSVQVVVPQGVRLTPGTYPILTATGGAEGTFAALDISTVSAANAGLSLVYSENAVSLKVQTRGVAVFVR